MKKKIKNKELAKHLARKLGKCRFITFKNGKVVEEVIN